VHRVSRFLSSLGIKRCIVPHFIASIKKRIDLLSCRLLAESLADKPRELVPCDDDLFAANTIMLICDGHRENVRFHLIDHLLEFSIATSNLGNLRVDVGEHDHLKAMHSLHPVSHLVDGLVVVDET
jgi:hypothetical protein